MEKFDNGIMRFKKELWSICTSMKVFDNIPEEHLEKVKTIFENSISNHQHQILQQQGEGNDGLIKQTLVGEINKEVQSLKQITRDSLQQDKQSKFDAQLEKKQTEFDTMMNKNIPPTPKFSDDVSEDPISGENLDAMIQKQMKERETVLNLGNNMSNQVIANQNISTDSFQPTPTFQDNFNFKSFEEKINKLEEKIRVQSSILEKIAQSQIAILNKIK